MNWFIIEIIKQGKKLKQKVEKEIIELIDKPLDNKEYILSWVKYGLRYFHNIAYVDFLKIKLGMIIEENEGYSNTLNEQVYWLPKAKFG